MIKPIAFFVAAFAVLCPLDPAAAQQNETIRRIGFLSVFWPTHPGSMRWHRAFREGLHDLGWDVGRNIQIAYRWMERKRERLPGLVDELIRLKVELIVVHGGQAARIVQSKSKKMPVVMAEASDAVGRGIVQSLARPGGNITGLTSITPVLATKRLELLKEIVPSLSRVAVIWTQKSPASRYAWRAIQRPAQQLGLHLHSMELRNPDDLERALADAVRAGAGGFISTSGLIPRIGLKWVKRLAAISRLPAIFTNAAVVEAGGLMSYNRSTEDLYRRAAIYVDKILKGAKPKDLPVQQPTKFSLIVNLKTAKAQRITIPTSIMLRADKVIE